LFLKIITTANTGIFLVELYQLQIHKKADTFHTV
jgi:hypothetical protein